MKDLQQYFTDAIKSVDEVMLQKIYHVFYLLNIVNLEECVSKQWLLNKLMTNYDYLCIVSEYMIRKKN